MSSDALAKFAAFHHELFLQASQTVHQNTGLNNQEISSYSKNFQASISQIFLPSNLDEIIQETIKSNFLFFGDFHTLKQSQKGFESILSKLHENYPDKNICVALEIFNASDQNVLNDFLSGNIDEGEFLRKIDYKNSWGFPWDHYKPIVNFCSEYKIPIIGINSKFDSKNRLSKRDDFAGSILNSWAVNNKESLCLCLIGEYHLADEHILSRIHSEFSAIRVIANVDQISLNFSNTTIASPEYYKIKNNFFCIVNTVPWIKWNSLSMWEEIHHASEPFYYQEESEAYTEHHYDYDYQLLHVIRSIDRILKLDIDDSQLSHFNLYIRPDRATFQYLRKKLKIDRDEFLTSDKILQREGFYYFSNASTMIVQSYSVNRFAELAGFFLHNHFQKIKISDSFIRRTEFQVCATIAAFIMNPRRKIQRIEALTQYYDGVKRRRLIGQSKIRREAVKLAITIFNTLKNTGTIPKFISSDHLTKKDRLLNFLASRILGELIGFQLFEILLTKSKEADFEKINLIFKQDFRFHIQTLVSHLSQENRKVS